MKGSTFAELENLFLALSDKTRLRLLALMADGEVPVGFLADKLGESQPKVSRHLAYLRGCGVVSTRRDGKRIYYFIAYPSDPAAAEILGSTVSSLAPDGKGSKQKNASIEAAVIVKPRKIMSNDGPEDEEYHELDIYDRAYMSEEYDGGEDEDEEKDGEIEIFLL